VTCNENGKKENFTLILLFLVMSFVIFVLLAYLCMEMTPLFFQVSKPGSVKVEKLMNIERYSHVMHISSTVIVLLNLSPMRIAEEKVFLYFYVFNTRN